MGTALENRRFADATHLDFNVKQLTTEQRLLLAQAARAELGRRHLLEFATLGDPAYTTPHHIREIAEHLEAVERGELLRLIITCPPGSGKSTLLQLFCAWCLGRDPRRRVIASSFSAELAERNSRATRACLQSDNWPFASRLSDATAAMHRWDLAAGPGGLFAIGVGGAITGWRADLLVCDDLEGPESTQTESATIAGWFRAVAMPRLEPLGAVVIIQTRSREDDLIGRILSGPSAHEWKMLSLPAIAQEEGDPLGRKPGEALWPARWPLRQLERIKREMGSHAFAAQYLCNPLPMEGGLIKATWLTHCNSVPETFAKKILALDAAAKTGVGNDFSAIVCLGVTDSKFYVLDVWRRRVEYPDLIRAVASKFEEHSPLAIYVEDTSNAIALIQQLRRNSALPVVPVKTHGSKMSRIEGITGVLEAGKVLLPKEAPWLEDFERELLSFPNGKHDDQVDAFAIALGHAQPDRGPYWTKISTGVPFRTVY